MDAPKHHLQTPWALWVQIHAKTGKKWSDNLQNMYEFSTVEDFWCMVVGFLSQFARNGRFGPFPTELGPKNPGIVFYALENPHVGQSLTSKVAHQREKSPFKDVEWAFRDS